MVDKKDVIISEVVLVISAVLVFKIPRYFTIRYPQAYLLFFCALLLLVSIRLLIETRRADSFCQRWEKTRAKSYLVNITFEGITSAYTLLLGLIISMVFPNGYTPSENPGKASPAGTIIIALAFVLFGLGFGAMNFRKKEKRYLRECINATTE